MSKLTIRELAQMAGVSQTAVSFVLNNKPGVSDETRKKILEIIEQTHYKSDRNSKRLALQKSFNICLAYLETSSPFDDLFYFEVAKGMIASSNSYGYNIVLNKIEYFNGSYILPDVITHKDADGIIIFQDVDSQLIYTIESLGLPCVVVDSYANHPNVTNIGVDAACTAKEAVQYLIKNGHTQIGMIGSSFIPEFWIQSYNGYIAALSEQHLMINPAWVQNTAHDEDSAYQCMENIINTGSLPTGLYCCGDIFAIGAIRSLKKNGFSVPEDLSIIAVDNIILSKYFEPALTTIDFKKEEMGALALELLIKKIDGQKVDSVRLGSNGIIERQSVAKR